MNWTKEQEIDLRKYFSSMTSTQMEIHFSRSSEAVRKKASKLGISDKRTRDPHGTQHPGGFVLENTRHYKQKPVDLSKKIPVRIDHRTVVYIAKGLNAVQRNAIIGKYKPLPVV